MFLTRSAFCFNIHLLESQFGCFKCNNVFIFLEHYVAAESEWNCRMVKREVEIEAHLPLGVVALEMIIGEGVLHLAAGT